jgi:uncharacterized membrane protein YcaP (DUF421 family)
MSTWIVILIRSGFMFLVTLILLRVMGKRQPSRMTPFTLVNYLVIAILAALISISVIPNLMLGLIAIGVWALFSIALDYLALKSKVIHDLLNGKETVLIKQGKIMEENLFRVRLTGEELLRELRSKNFFNLTEVEFAVMETTGDINVLPKSEYKPVTPHGLGAKVAPQNESQTVILDGNIMDEPLASMGLNRAWLKLQLEKLGVSLTNVFIGQVDSSGELFIDLFDDSIILPQPKVKELLYANLEKVQADLTTFALETKDPFAKTMYSENSAKLQILLEKIKPYLLR